MDKTDPIKEHPKINTALPQDENPHLQTGKFAKKMYRAVFEQSSDGLMLLDTKTGLKVAYNQRACENLGYTHEEFRDIGLKDIETVETQTEVKVHTENILNGPICYETKIRHKEGAILEVLIRARMITAGDGEQYILVQWTDITQQKQTEKLLKEKQQKLEHTVTTLKALVETHETEKKDIEENILSRIRNLIEPYFKKLTAVCPDPVQRKYIEIIAANMKEFSAYRSENITSLYPGLTATEAQVANLIKQNKSSKEISDIMNVSTSTIDFHRKNIRHKLGLSNNKDRLKSYLLSLEDGIKKG